MKDRARRLRHTSTDAEQKLWSQLRDRRLGVKFRRQQSIGPFIVDFCCPEKWLRRAIICSLKIPNCAWLARTSAAWKLT
ncbi:MAG: DUF559 domain-containing protein [Candidatus Binataceae bacterium]